MSPLTFKDNCHQVVGLLVRQVAAGMNLRLNQSASSSSRLELRSLIVHGTPFSALLLFCDRKQSGTPGPNPSILTAPREAFICLPSCTRKVESTQLFQMRRAQVAKPVCARHVYSVSATSFPGPVPGRVSMGS